jgi:hypothetical protein
LVRKHQVEGKIEDSVGSNGSTEYLCMLPRKHDEGVELNKAIPNTESPGDLSRRVFSIDKSESPSIPLSSLIPKQLFARSP